MPGGSHLATLCAVADVAVVVDGQLYLPSVRRLPAGGRQVTERLRQLLAARGLQINDAAVLQGLKEACMDAEDGGGEAQVGQRLCLKPC